MNPPAAGWRPLIFAVVLMAIIGAGAGIYWVATTPLSRAGMGMNACTVTSSSRGRLAWLMDWTEPLCMVEAWDTLERFGFDGDDIARSLDEGGPVVRGDWSMRAVELDRPSLVQVTVLPAG